MIKYIKNQEEERKKFEKEIIKQRGILIIKAEKKIKTKKAKVIDNV